MRFNGTQFIDTILYVLSIFCFYFIIIKQKKTKQNNDA